MIPYGRSWSGAGRYAVGKLIALLAVLSVLVGGR